LWTLTGLPALSLPLFAGADGLPIGAQLVGTLGRDGRLLRTATALIEMLRETKKGRRSSRAKIRS
jgi:Asp-tRNA(Asn)/Glu-tRNA(Gln) amidotransferase A subunit family amidase